MAAHAVGVEEAHVPSPPRCPVDVGLLGLIFLSVAGALTITPGLSFQQGPVGQDAGLQESIFGVHVPGEPGAVQKIAQTTHRGAVAFCDSRR